MDSETLSARYCVERLWDAWLRYGRDLSRCRPAPQIVDIVDERFGRCSAPVPSMHLSGSIFLSTAARNPDRYSMFGLAPDGRVSDMRWDPFVEFIRLNQERLELALADAIPRSPLEGAQKFN